MRLTRAMAVTASAALLVGAFVMPADAAKKKKPKKCAPMTASEWSADQPINLVTDKHTAEAPLELELETPEGIGFFHADAPEGSGDVISGHTFLNVQVDSAAPTTGLYGLIEFSPAWDYDLGFRDEGGVAMAYSAGGAPWAGPFDGTGAGGQAHPGTEQIDGMEIADCQGILVDVVSALTPGETVTLKLWLGEATYVPGG